MKNQEVLKAMSEKKKLVAELLEIPMGDYEHIAEVSLSLNLFQHIAEVSLSLNLFQFCC